MSKQSETSEDLHLLDNAKDFQIHALQMAQKAQRDLRIVSTSLDFTLYDHQPFVDAVSTLARSSRNSTIELLIKDSRPLTQRGHKLLHLANRLPSKITIRKLGIEPEDENMAFLMIDDHMLLFQKDEQEYVGFANYAARPEVKIYEQVFERLWQYSQPDPQLRRLSI